MTVTVWACYCWESLTWRGALFIIVGWKWPRKLAAGFLQLLGMECVPGAVILPVTQLYENGNPALVIEEKSAPRICPSRSSTLDDTSHIGCLWMAGLSDLGEDPKKKKSQPDVHDSALVRSCGVRVVESESSLGWSRIRLKYTLTKAGIRMYRRNCF